MSAADALLAALEASDADAVVALLDGVAEPARRALAKTLAAFVPPWDREGAERMLWDERLPTARAISVARVGVQTLGELKKDWRDLQANSPEHVVRLVSARRPPWLQGWLTFLLERPGGWLSRFWPIVRALVRAGLVERPDHAGYALGMIHGVSRGRDNDHRQSETWQEQRARRGVELAEDLRADAELLDHELWQLFETEGTRDHQLGDPWLRALCALSADGTLDRQRLLDASLASLARDFAQFKAAWYAQLHSELAPTLDERSARTDRYLALCASRIAPTVVFALDALRELDAAGRLDADGVLAYVPAALTAKATKNVRAALELLQRAAQGKPSLALSAARAIACALEHPAAEVQRRALDAIVELVPQPAADAELAQSLAAAVELVSASLRERVLALCGDAVQAAAPSDEIEHDAAAIAKLRRRAEALPASRATVCGVRAAVEALEASGVALLVPRAPRVSRAELPSNRAPMLEPVRELDELIELCAALIESADDPVQLERLLDGLSRFAAAQPDDLARRLAPLKKRANTLMSRRWGTPFSEARSLGACVCGLLLAWAERAVPEPQQGERLAPLSEPGLDGFVQWRMREVAGRLARRDPGALLATPTRRDGLIDARALLERGRGLSRAPDLFDGVQALLRLGFEQRAETLRAFPRAGSEIGRAFRYALGAPLEGPVRTPQWWLAAARAREPLAERLPELTEQLPAALRGAPDADVRAAYALRFSRRGRWTHLFVESVPEPPAKPASSAFATVALHDGSRPVRYGDSEFSGSAGLMTCDVVRAAAQIWPQQREAYYAEGLRCFGGNVEWSSALWGYRHFLEPLLDPCEPCGEMATAMLAVALGAKEPGERALALDVATVAIEEGRLDGVALGAAYGEMVPSGLLTVPRLASALDELARSSQQHAAQVRLAIAGALRAGGDGTVVRGMHALIELLCELCMRADGALDDSIDADGEARAFLAQIGAKGSSKAAKLARALLALEPGRRREAFARAVAAEALQTRLRRAESWRNVS